MRALKVNFATIFGCLAVSVDIRSVPVLVAFVLGWRVGVLFPFLSLLSPFSWGQDTSAFRLTDSGSWKLGRAEAGINWNRTTLHSGIRSPVTLFTRSCWELAKAGAKNVPA